MFSSADAEVFINITIQNLYAMGTRCQCAVDEARKILSELKSGAITPGEAVNKVNEIYEQKEDFDTQRGRERLH